MAEDVQKGSEYGGVDGLIQPAPHKPTSAETLGLLMRSGDPADPTSGDGLAGIQKA